MFLGLGCLFPSPGEGSFTFIFGRVFLGLGCQFPSPGEGSFTFIFGCARALLLHGGFLSL